MMAAWSAMRSAELAEAIGGANTEDAIPGSYIVQLDTPRADVPTSSAVT